LSVEDNAKLVEPGFDMMTPKQQADILSEVSSVIAAIGKTHGNGQWKKKLMIKDATMNLNGDYLSDALAAQVGGIGIAPGGNINYITGMATRL
jgi:isocitrate dehydrogenase